MLDSATATSPATAPAAETGDANRAAVRSGNISSDQAAAQLFASASRQAAQQPVQPATEENPPEKSEPTPEKPVAEAADASVETATEEAAPADQATAGQDSEEEADTVHSQTSTFTPEQQKIFDKRLGKEVGKRKALEARLAELEEKQAELATAQSAPQAVEQQQQQPPPQVPIAPLPTVGHQLVDKAASPYELEVLSDNATTAIGFADDALLDPNLGHDLADTVQIAGKDWTRGELIGLRKNARDAIQAIPKKARMFHAQSQFFQAREQASKVAREKFPFLADKKSPEYQMAQAMLRDPWVQMRPDAEYIVGVQIRGLAALEAENATKRAGSTAATPAKPKAPTVKPSPDQTAISASASAARSPVGTNRQALNAEREKFNGKKGVTTADAIAHLTRMEQLRNSR